MVENHIRRRKEAGGSPAGGAALEVIAVPEGTAGSQELGDGRAGRNGGWGVESINTAARGAAPPGSGMLGAWKQLHILSV